MMMWLLFLALLVLSGGCSTQIRHSGDTEYFGAGPRPETSGNRAPQSEVLFPSSGGEILDRNERRIFQGPVKFPTDQDRSLPEKGGNFSHHSLDILPDRTSPSLPSSSYMLERFNSGSPSGNFSHHRLDSLPNRTFPSTIDRY